MAIMYTPMPAANPFASEKTILHSPVSHSHRSYRKLKPMRFMSKVLFLITSSLLFTLGINAQVTQTFNSSGSFTVPAGVTSITVRTWGAGGGGGSLADATGGGGGGAYASSVLTVTPGATYSVSVGLGGTAGNPGASSSFGGTLVVAAGGSSTAGTIGGAGGTVAASTGTTRFAGGKGGDAATNSGGGGGGSATTIGAGGAGDPGSGTTGGNGGTGEGNGGRGGDRTMDNSTAGSPPGGGGGGRGRDSGTSKSGANGRVTISWTVCPTYSLTSTVISSTVCTGNAATVTLSGSAASLPVGIYTVSYSLSGANTGSSTATMTVASAGTGTFTTSTFTNAGLTTVTISNLSSGSGTPNCSSGIGSNNTASVDVGTLAAPLLEGLSASKTLPPAPITATFSTAAAANFYQFEYKASSSGTWIPIGTLPYTSNSIMVTGIDDETDYDFRVAVSCDGVNFSAFTALTPAVLPIELLSFAGKRVDGTVQLHWVTASEKDNKYMEVQRSSNGKTFEPLGVVPGNGDSYRPVDYTFVDDQPLPGVNYYRLKQVDFDGKFEYHKVIAVLFKDQDDKVQGITLFPTVVSEQLNFALSQETTTDGEYYISDLNGRVLLRQAFERGMQQQSIPVHRLPKGQYILTVQTGREMQVARFVKE